jgi:hypothetical protein
MVVERPTRTKHTLQALDNASNEQQRIPYRNDVIVMNPIRCPEASGKEGDGQ